MKMFSRSFLAAAFSAALAPALLAELSGVNLQSVAGNRPLQADVRSPRFLPSGSGSGSGLWIAPSDINGVASAKLYDADGVHRYSLRSTLVYFVPLGEGDVQGGFFGTLLAKGKDGKVKKVADVSGTWIHRADGSGDFAAAIVASVPGGPSYTVGHMAGSMQSATPSARPRPGLHLEPYDDEPSQPASFARLSMSWSISE